MKPLGSEPDNGSNPAGVKKRLTFFWSHWSKWAGSFAFFILFCGPSDLLAQFDAQFSQYMLNPLGFNPGVAGMGGRINTVIANRQQWVGFEGAPKTTVVGADMGLNFMGNSGGVGLVILNDEIGFSRNLSIQGGVAQNFDLGEGKLGVGLSLGLLNQVFDGASFVANPDESGSSSYHQSSDNLVPDIEISGSALDFGFGFYYRHKKFYGGFSVLHLFQPEPNFQEEMTLFVPRTFYFTGGYHYAFWEMPVVLQPSFLLKSSGPIIQFDLNLNAVFRDKYWGGLTYRLQDALVLLGGIELANGVRIGYSYDLTTSRLAKAGGGSHEVVVGYTFDLNLDKREKRYKSVRFL